MKAFTCFENIYCICKSDEFGNSHDELDEKVMKDTILVIRRVEGRAPRESITNIYITNERVIYYFNVELETYCTEWTIDKVEEIISEFEKVRRLKKISYKVLKPELMNDKLKILVQLIDEKVK